MVDLPNMVASAMRVERSQFSLCRLLSNNSITTKKIREILPKKMRLVTLTSSTKVRENLEELGLEVEMLEDSLSSQGLSVQTIFMTSYYKDWAKASLHQMIGYLQF